MHVQSCMILWGLIFSNLFGVHFETLVSSQIQNFWDAKHLQGQRYKKTNNIHM